MYTLPRKHLRSSDIPPGDFTKQWASPKNYLPYLGFFFLAALSYPIVSELIDDLTCEPRAGWLSSKEVRREEMNNRQAYVPAVAYSYVIGETTFHSDKLFGGFGKQVCSSAQEASEILSDLNVNSPCTVYVNPWTPSTAFLKHISEQSSGFYVNLLLGLAIVISFIYIGWPELLTKH